MPGEAIIGSVSVKVIPDLSRFRKEAKAKLDAAESGLDPVEVEITADGKGLKTEVKRAFEEADRAAGDIEVDVKVDNKSALASIRTLNDSIRRARTSLKLDVDMPDTTDLLGRMQRVVSDVNRGVRDSMDDMKMNIQMQAIWNGTRMRREVNDHISELEKGINEIETRLSVSVSEAQKARLNGQLKAMQADLDDMHAKVIPVLERGAWGIVRLELARLTRPEVKQIIVKINKASAKTVGNTLSRIMGIRMLWDLHREKFDILANFDKHAPKIATLSTAIGGLAAWLGQAAMDAISLARGIGQIVGAGIALPGMLAGAGLAFYAFKTAFADFNEVVPGFQASIEEMQKAMSKNFWAEAARPMQNMLDNLFPQFERGMQKIAKAAGTFTAAMSKSLEGAFGRGILEQMMNPVNVALNTMAKSTDHVANSLQILLEIGLKQLPRFAEWWNNVNKSLSDFLTQARNDGTLQNWIDNGVRQLKHLASSIWNVGVLFNELGAIAERAGASTLESMDRTLQKMVEVSRSPEFQQGLFNMLYAINTAFDQIGAQVGPAIARLAGALSRSIPQILATLGPSLANFLGSAINALASKGFQSGMQEMFRGVSSALATLEPVLGTVGDKLGLIMGVVGEIVAQMAPLLKSFIEETAMLLEKVADPFKNFLMEVGPMINDLFQQLGPMFEGLGDGVAKLLDVLGPVLKDLGEALSPVVGKVAQALGDGFRRIADALAPILPQLGEFLGKIGNVLGDVLVVAINLVVVAIEKLAPILGRVIELAIQLVDWLAPKIEALLPIVQKILEFIIETIASTVEGFVNGISNVIEGIMNIFNGVIEFVVGVFTGDWERAWEGIKEIFSGIWQLIVGIFQTIVFGYLLGGVIKFLAAVKALWSAGWNVVKGTFTAAWDAIRNFFTQGATNIRQTFTDMLGRLYTAAVEGGGRIVQWAKELPGKIVDMFRGAGDKLAQVGKDIVNGLVRGLEAGRQWIVDKVQSLANLIPDWMKKILDTHSPSRVMYDIGLNGVVAGITTALDDGRRHVKESMERLSDVISDTDLSIGSVDMSALKKVGGNVPLITASVMAGAGVGPGLGASQYSAEVNLYGSDLSANDVAGELLGAFRKADRGGKYRRNG